MRTVVYLGLVSIVTGAAVFAGCASNNTNTFDTPTDDGGTNGDVVDPNIGYDSSGDTIANCTTCSGDLHNILTCGDNPTVVQTCTGDTGCGPNGCIPACEAAAANKSSIGCDYYTIPTDSWSANFFSGATYGDCFAAFVANNWQADMKVTLVWKGKTIDATPYAYIPKGSGNAITYQPIPSTGIPPNSMAIVFLNQTKDSGGGTYKVLCPNGVKAAVENEDVAQHGTGVGHAMELQTSVPAVVYDIYPYGGAASYFPSATLLLPTTAWDTNYVTITMNKEIASFPSDIDFVSQQDGTTITLLPSVDVVAGPGVTGGTANKPINYTLNKGQLMHFTQISDLSGSVVQSNNPLGVWGEHYCMNLADQSPPWRILGAVNGTTLTYDPPVPAGPKTLAKGQLLEFDAPGPFRITSQDDMHPFYLAAHRPGGDCDGAHQQIPPIKALGHEYVAVANESTYFSVGGPETVNVVPPQEFLDSYIFFTDPTYGYTDLALVRGKAGDGTYKDVTLDCVGVVGGWKQIGAGPYQYTHVDVQTGHMPVGKCDNGLHTIKSTAPFGITVWGYDSAASYAYPAGASVKPINTVVIPPTPN